MDRVRDSSGALAPGVDAIDRIGVSAIVRSLGISKQAVQKRRRRDGIPDNRLGDIRRLLETLPEQVSAVCWVAKVSDVVKTIPPEPEGAIGLFEGHGDCRLTEASREARGIDHRFFTRSQKDVLR